MMFGQNLDLWKLDTPVDYMNFFIVVAFFVLLVYLGVRKINSGRNDASAAKKVEKNLKFTAKKVVLLNDVNLEIKGKSIHFDHLLLDNAGVVAMRTIGWGTKIYGSLEEAQWTAVDNKDEKRSFDNPIAEMEANFDLLRQTLSKKDMYGVAIEPLAIFADPFDTPELYLGRDSRCITFADLKAWKKQRILRSDAKKTKGDAFDFAAAVKCIEEAKKA